MKYSIFIALLLFCLALLSLNCNSVFYQPDHDIHYAPEDYKIQYRDIYIPGDDSNMIHARFFPAQGGKAKATVVQFHGNAQNLTSHFAFLYWLTKEGYHLLTFDYRGYGQSGGIPDRDGVRKDTITLLQYLEENPDHLSWGEGLILYGHSLGTIILMESLLERGGFDQALGIVLEGSFATYRGIAASVLAKRWFTWPLVLPAMLFVTDTGAPNGHLGEIMPGTPKLILHGEKDEVIPVKFGKKVYKKIAGPKEMEIFAWGGHNNLYNAGDKEAAKTTLAFFEQIMEASH